MGCRTQAEFAQALGITQARVSQILSGSHPVKPGPLLVLIRKLQAEQRRVE
jgi:transcriptional regulator with XRE-family HTH domain